MPKSLATRRLMLLLQEARRRNLAAAGEPPPVPRAAMGGFTRRRLIKTGAMLAAAGPLAVAARPFPALAAGAAKPRIAIVGGGIAGLNAAYQLKKRGLRATIYEARNRLGGRMLSIEGAVEPGLVNDLGGSLVNTDHADMLALIKELGLGLFDRHADARRHGLPFTAYLLGGRLMHEAELASLLRPLAEQITADADLLDQDYERYAPYFDGMSMRQYLDRNQHLIPTPFVRHLVEQTARTELGVEPDQTGAIQLLFILPSAEGRHVDLLSYSDETYAIEGGSARVTDKLAQVLQGQTITGRQLTAIEGNEAGGYRLAFARTDGKAGAGLEQVAADIVVMAIPFTTLRRAAIRVSLPPLLRRGIDELDLGHNEKVFAGFRSRPWRRPEGFAGDLLTDGTNFAELWDDTQRQLNRPHAVLNFYLGGDQVARAFDGAAAETGRRDVDILDHALPGVAAAATGRYLRTDWQHQPFTRGSYATFRPGQYTRFDALRYIESPDPAERQEVRVGNLHFAGEHTSDEYFGFMNGAAQTGRLAAESILNRLGRSA